jgi:very-short-patch-repair endonuclease
MTAAADAIKRAQAKAKRESLELAVLQQLRALRLDAGMRREYRFDPERLWRADFAWPAHHLLLEIEGGTYVQGRHSRGTGMAEDCEKYAAAVLAGWRVLRATTDQVRSGIAAEWVATALRTSSAGAMPDTTQHPA